MIKKKPICKKGINKAFGFPGCGSETWKLNMGLCPACEYDFLTTTEAGKILFEKRKLKVKSDKWKEEKKVLRDNTKKLSKYEAEAKKSFQKYIRLRDAGKECVSCLKHKESYDGGHYKKAEIYSGVIFHEMNCHAQCRKCNRFLNGNELNYRKGLIIRYSEEYANFIEDLANSTRIKKYTKQELIDIKKKYDLKIKNNDFNN